MGKSKMNEKLTEDILKLLQERPVELDHEYSFISQEEKAALSKNTNDIEMLNEEWEKPLKVVLMGEVKAGKSTLLNAIVGEELSPVGVTETTAVIMEIAHGLKKEALILKKDGLNEKMDIEKLYQVLEENRDNPNFYAEIERIKLHYPLKTLKKIRIIDTPGIETITTANQETTKSFIQKSDVVLWVLSVHHLGQVGIDEEIMEVAEHGKPIIMLVNRIDQTNDDVDEIMNFIDDTYGFYVDAAFPVSGFKAFEGKKNEDEALYKESGMAEVLTYLEENIDVAAAEVKEGSVFASALQIIIKEKLICTAISEEILFVKDAVKSRQEESKYFQDKINATIKQSAESWLANEFLQEEKTAILRAIATNSKSILKDNTGEIKNMLTEYFSDEYIRSSLQKLLLELKTYSEKEIENALKVMGEKFKQEEEEYFERISIGSFNVGEQFSLIQTEDTFSDLIDGAKKGVFVGGAYGLAAATYTAILGPSAAAITIGAALGTVIPPVLMLGAVTGAAIKFVNKDKKTKELEEHTYKQFEKIQHNVSDILTELIDQMATSNTEYFDNLYQQLVKFILKGSTAEELTVQQKEISIYIKKLDNILNRAEISSDKTEKVTAKIIKGNFNKDKNVTKVTSFDQEDDSYEEPVIDEKPIEDEESIEEIKDEKKQTIDDTINDLLS